jgi:hypothetical protein
MNDHSCLANGFSFNLEARSTWETAQYQSLQKSSTNVDGFVCGEVGGSVGHRSGLKAVPLHWESAHGVHAASLTAGVGFTEYLCGTGSSGGCNEED